MMSTLERENGATIYVMFSFGSFNTILIFMYVLQKVLELGGYLARSSVEATHLVMGSSTAQRTVKFMCALSSCRYIVSLQWIIDSHREAKFLCKYQKGNSSLVFVRFRLKL